MNFIWHLYPLNPSFVNTPQQHFTGNDAPTVLVLTQALGIDSADNPAMTKVLEDYYLFSFGYPALGSPQNGGNVAVVYACIRTPA